jgi:CelD/BcsL family acetyltransferase involved in cellulose biosynthesis
VDSRIVSTAPYVDLSAGFEAYRMSLRKKRRGELDHSAGKMFGAMDVRYWRCDPGEFPTAVRTLFDLHRRRAASLRRGTVFRGERLIRFHEDVAVRLQQQGQLWLRFLRHGERPIAAWYCFECHGRLLAYQTGLDPAWEKHGVGNLLLFEVFREASEQGLKEVDLLRGGHSKSRWTKRTRALTNINMYNDTVVAHVARWGARKRAQLAHAVRRGL